MKSKWHNQIKLLNYIAATDKFRIIFLLTIFLALYGGIVLGISTNNFIDSILIPLQFPIFNIFMFALLFLNTLNTCSIFNKEFSFYIIRLNTKKKYVYELLKTVLSVNLLLLVLFFLIFFIILNLFKLGNIEIHTFQNYSISNLSYVVFYLFRYICFAMIICLISVILFINFKEKLTLLLDSIFLIGFMLIRLDIGIRNIVPFLPWYYFSGVEYASFINEVCYSLLYLLVMEFIFILCYKFTIKRGKMEIV